MRNQVVLEFLRSLFVLLLLTLPQPAWAEADEFARNAVEHADKRNWNDAMIHAKRSSAPGIVKLITWQYVLDQDSGASFDEITRFIDENPDWPEMKRLRLRAEQSLKSGGVADNDIIAWFTDNEPVTGIGKIALADAMRHMRTGDQEKITSLVRDGWKNGDFDEAQEIQVAATYASLLRKEDDIARLDRLLWEEKITPAKRMMNRVSQDYQKLAKARMALQENKKTSVLLVANVPPNLRKTPGLIYDRMRYRLRKDDNSGVRDMLLAAPVEVPYPEKWWKPREVQIRKAIDEKNFTMAKKLLANHGQADGVELADATWLKGWLLTEFLNQPKAGYDAFYHMHSSVRYPVSKARAAYWAGRAAEKSGDEETASNWYNTASAYPTTFYGQLASLKHNGTAPLHIPASPAVSSAERQAFESSDLAKAIKLCVELDETDLASRMISWVAENAQTDSRAAIAAEFGKRIGQPFLSVRAAKKALQRNIVMADAGYPLPKTPASEPVERALTLAITRQESEFDRRAKSPSGAIGMMQLLPSTAKETARKADMGYALSSLYERDYNMTLGSLYLQRLVNSYDGSYIMAIAAYNAGPGNVRGWSQQFGTPGNSLDSAVNWIEKIPFYETRNYVQRVLENLQVYRHLDADGESPKLQLGEDLVR